MKYMTLLGIGIFGFLFIIVNTLEAEDKVNSLNIKEQNIVLVAANAARGNQAGLKTALASGLDAGVTVNEFKEILVQVYAYCGFPRSLNALETFMVLLQERGNKDVQGVFPGPVPKGKSIDFGTVNQTKLCGAPVKGPLFDFAPAIDEYLKAHLFGDIFARDNLDWRTRELATIAMLAAIEDVEPQLNAHIAIGKKNGLTDRQINAILDLVKKQLYAPINPGFFPLGKENTGFVQYFSGKSWLAPLTSNKELAVPVFNVTFAPGCRNNWHKHSGGQILIVVGGIGYYQERGKAAQRLIPGDIIEIPINIEHWHGAAPDCWFSHLAIECNPKTNKNTWMEPVSDEDYRNAVSKINPPQSVPMVRLSKIRVEASQLESYNTFLKEEITASMNLEPGVLTLYAVAEKNDPTRITIMEIYSDEMAYKSHLNTPHFRKYKEETQNMVKELELLDASPLLPGLKIK